MPRLTGLTLMWVGFASVWAASVQTAMAAAPQARPAAAAITKTTTTTTTTEKTTTSTTDPSSLRVTVDQKLDAIDEELTRLKYSAHQTGHDVEASFQKNLKSLQTKRDRLKKDAQSQLQDAQDRSGKAAHSLGDGFMTAAQDLQKAIDRAWKQLSTAQ